jgi:hypothetical protein
MSQIWKEPIDHRTKPLKQKPWPDEWRGCYTMENVRFKPLRKVDKYVIITN